MQIFSSSSYIKSVSTLKNYLPCDLDGSTCISAIGKGGTARSISNWGSPVDIWAPDGVYSTITRDSAAKDGGVDNIGLDELVECIGRSCAAPVVTGVVAMMKMLDGNLYASDVETI